LRASIETTKRTFRVFIRQGSKTYLGTPEGCVPPLPAAFTIPGKVTKKHKMEKIMRAMVLNSEQNRGCGIPLQ
jgi:hypothetical protein